MAANKISYCGKVLLDLASDTITPEKLAKGVTQAAMVVTPES